ncbi:MAG TPA: MMPL family transporter [Gammaproteobacteria bacterium]|nr:MMPL family transporter [Gammaproteobacteria bacterium]
MQHLLLQFARHPRLWLAFLLAASVLAATQLGELRVRVAADEMLVINDPQRAYYEKVKQTFGEEKVVLLVIEDQQLLAPDKLAVLKEVVDQLAALPFVTRTESLFSVPHVKSVEGYLDKEPYLAKLPETPQEGAALLATALKNPLIRNLLVSPGGNAMAVAVVLKDGDREVDDSELTAAITRTIAPLEQAYTRVYPIGFAQVRSELATRIMDEQATLMPLAVGALLIALFLLLRQMLDILTPLVTAAVSILWTFGLMGWLGIPINVVTSTIPILLIVVGSTEDIHLLAEFRHAQRCGDAKPAALRHMARRMGRTVLLTFVTTYAGFLSVGLSGIEVLRQFGLVASTGLLFNFIVTIIFIPAALSLTGHWQLDGRSRLFEERMAKWAERYWRFIDRHRRRAFVLLTACAVLAAFGIPRIQINHNPTDSLGETSPVAQQIARLNEQFAGLESFSVVIESGIQDTFLHARYLHELVKVQNFIQAMDASLSATSFADYLALLNGAFLESENAGVPRSNDEIAELMIFLDHDRVSGYANEDYSQVRIQVRHNIATTDALRKTLGKIRAFIDENLDPGLSARITGDSTLTLSATDSMIAGQLQSVLMILTLFVLIVSFLFTDLRVGLLAALPNIFPIIILFGVMGYAGIPLNIGTTMAAAIAMGIAVDDTLHFMLRYNQELRTSKSQALAMQKTIYEEALPVVSTSVALTVGFLVFAQSDFTPVAQFGLLSALVISTALVADFVITPLAMSLLRLVTLWDLLSSRLRHQIIPRSPLFRGMRPWQIRKFVLSSTLLEFNAGDYVYRKDDDSNALYLVMKGVVEITLPRGEPESRDPIVDQFGSGQIFGDVALLANEARKTNAVALTNTTLMVLSREAIANVTFFHPFIASRLFLNLARDVSKRWVTFIGRVRTPRGDLREEDDNP